MRWSQVPALFLLTLALAFFVGRIHEQGSADSDGNGATIGLPAVAPPDRHLPSPLLEIRAFNFWYRAVLVDSTAVEDPHELEAIGRSMCNDVIPCQVGIWYHAGEMPDGLPVDGPEIQGQVFAFGRTAAGAESARWNCDVFPQFEDEQLCMPRAH